MLNIRILVVDDHGTLRKRIADYLRTQEGVEEEMCIRDRHPADDVEGTTITTHYDFNSMHDILVKLDCCLLYTSRCV